MAQININVGTPNGNDGDTVRNAMVAIEANTADLYNKEAVDAANIAANTIKADASKIKTDLLTVTVPIDLDNLDTGGGTTVPIDVHLPIGKSIGKYIDGDTIPISTTIDLLVTNIAQESIIPPWDNPTVSLSSATPPNNTTEVGTTLVHLLTASPTINDGGPVNAYTFKKDGNIISGPNLTTTKSETTIFTNSAILYQVDMGYDALTSSKNDNLGNPVIDTIPAGTANSNILSYTGYYKIFFGPTATLVTDSVSARALPSSRFQNAGNVFNLVTGNTELNFQFWLPNGVNLVSVIDLDALNANITSTYIASALSVNDAGGTPVVGTLYTLTQGVPYSTSHNHQITIS